MHHRLFYIRFLNHSDIDTIKSLCEEWFPIKYPDNWYKEIASNSYRYYSVVGILNDQIVGLLVAEIKSYFNCDYEDFGFLSKFSEKNSQVAYLLTLGVIHTMRRNGIATILIKNLINNLETNPEHRNCKAIYLHVLTTNTRAIGFYEKLKFRRYKLLPLYYSINDHACDGYSYVFYINNGHPPSFWLSILNPKTYLFIAKNALSILYQSTINTFKCDQIKCFVLIVNNLKPYKYLKKIFRNLIFLFSFKSGFGSGNKTKSDHIYVC